VIDFLVSTFLSPMLLLKTNHSNLVSFSSNTQRSFPEIKCPWQRIEVPYSVFNISVTLSSSFLYAPSSYLSLGVTVAASVIHHTK